MTAGALAAPTPTSRSSAPGVMGLALAYNLAARGRQRIVVLDAHYLAWGASGRNGGGVRQQWSTEMNVRLMQESVELCAHFAREMGINVWMRRGGYLFLARTKAARERAWRRTSRCRTAATLPTRIITLDDARELVPELEVAQRRARGLRGRLLQRDRRIVFPWPFLWGYARAAERRGVDDPHGHARHGHRAAAGTTSC